MGNQLGYSVPGGHLESMGLIKDLGAFTVLVKLFFTKFSFHSHLIVSRFVIFFGECPITWVYKLQTEVDFYHESQTYCFKSFHEGAYYFLKSSI